MFSIIFGLQAPVILKIYFKCFFPGISQKFHKNPFSKTQFIPASMIFTLREKSKTKISTAFEILK